MDFQQLLSEFPFKQKIVDWISPHRMLWLLAFICFLIAWNRGLALLYGCFALLAAMLLLSYWFAKSQLLGLSLKREVGEPCEVGQEAAITFHLNGAKKAYFLAVEQTLECSSEGHSGAVYWHSTLQPTRVLPFRCDCRGIYDLADVQISSSFPFGLVKVSRSYSLPKCPLIVFPKIFPLVALPPLAWAESDRVGEMPYPNIGGQSEFACVRDYQPGDAMRHIHWSVSARKGQWIVREFERTDRATILLVLNCNNTMDVGRQSEHCFEYAVSLAASICHYASQQGLSVHVAANQGKLCSVSIPPHCVDLYSVLLLLAGLKCDQQINYGQFVDEAASQFPQANMIYTFRLNDEQMGVDLPQHKTHVDLMFNGNSFVNPLHGQHKKRQSSQGNRLQYEIDAGSSLRNLFQ